MSRITLVKQELPGLETNAISPLQDISCMQLRNTGQKVGLPETVFDDGVQNQNINP